MTTPSSRPLTDDDLHAIDALTALAAALHEHGYTTHLNTTTSPRLAITQPATDHTEHVYAGDGLYCWDSALTCPGHDLPRHLPLCETEPAALTRATKAITLLMTLAALHHHSHQAGTP